jgi:hypothetical protein
MLNDRKNEHVVQGIIIVSQNCDIRVSGTIVKPPNVRVEEIALQDVGKRGVRLRIQEGQIQK